MIFQLEHTNNSVIIQWIDIGWNGVLLQNTMTWYHVLALSNEGIKSRAHFLFRFSCIMISSVFQENARLYLNQQMIMQLWYGKNTLVECSNK